jgi:hypothetical protein
LQLLLVLAAWFGRDNVGDPKVESTVPSTGSESTQRSEVDTLSTLKQLQAAITSRMRRGDTFATIEDEVINPSALSEPEKAALWLYGWSFVDWRRQRREAIAHIDLLTAEDHGVERTRRPRRALREPLRR